jgi:hypothetical protein
VAGIADDPIGAESLQASFLPPIADAELGGSESLDWRDEG